jgi:hypothetical protein
MMLLEKDFCWQAMRLMIKVSLLSANFERTYPFSFLFVISHACLRLHKPTIWHDEQGMIMHHRRFTTRLRSGRRSRKLSDSWPKNVIAR